MTEEDSQASQEKSKVTTDTSPEISPKVLPSSQVQNISNSHQPIDGVRPRAVWPFDAALTIAMLALVVSVVQFILTTPVLLDLYLHPDVVVTNIPNRSPEMSSVAFGVVNEGRVSAQDVEIGIMSFEDDKLVVMPELGASVTHNESKLYRTFRVVVPYLASGEGVTVVVHLMDQRHQMASSIVGNLVLPNGTNKSVQMIVPSIVYARSKTGPGRILSTRFDMIPVEELRALK